jgi:L-threonylcarbamoyladenylate synthase
MKLDPPMRQDDLPNTATKTRFLAADLAGIGEAAALLRAGRLVAFPTETVYGLGADATNPAAVARIYAAKGRPSFNPLIAHVADIAAALELAEFDTVAKRLATAFWPGPLTLVLPVREAGGVCDLARAGLASIAIRVPDHPVAQALLRAADRPIAAPSANRSGHISPSAAAHVADDLSGEIDAILDGGPVAIGVESTILACLDGQVTMLRPGGLPREAIERALGQKLAEATLDDSAAPLAPGRLSSHYAPNATIRLNATEIAPDEACLAFGPVLPPGADARFTLNLSAAGQIAEAAANLYAHLRTLDRLSRAKIAIMPLPTRGLGEAISDRLQRAAAKR